MKLYEVLKPSAIRASGIAAPPRLSLLPFASLASFAVYLQPERFTYNLTSIPRLAMYCLASAMLYSAK